MLHRAGASHDGGEDSSSRRQPRRSEDSKPSRSNSRNTSAAGGSEQRGLRGLFFNILRSRYGGDRLRGLAWDCWQVVVQEVIMLLAELWLLQTVLILYLWRVIILK